MPEAVQALGDAGGDVLAMVAGPRVHAGVARALRELQSELRGGDTVACKTPPVMLVFGRTALFWFMF